MMKFFVKDFCETVEARVFIFGMQVDNDVSYCGIANQIHFYVFPLFGQREIIEMTYCYLLWTKSPS